MSGTVAGGKKTVQVVKAFYGEDHYRRIGAIGGAHSTTGGFYSNRKLASIAGRLGGSISRRYKGDGTKGAPVNPKEYAVHRREFDKAYEHLMGIKQAAETSRQAAQRDIYFNAGYLPVPGTKAEELARDI